MAKQQTFMDKVKKAQMTAPTCPECGEPISIVRVVEAVPHEGSPTRFQRNQVKMCKCNQKEIMGG
jgi:hypothetical protein